MNIAEALSLVLKTASASFVDVTAFVGLALFVFGLLNFWKGGGIVEAMRKHKRWQVVFGALLGLIPGCGGAILVMPLFVKRHVGFGAVVATLIGTAGDSAFVLIAKAPKEFLILSGVSFVVGIAVGYLVDYLKIGEKYLKKGGVDVVVKGGCNCRRLKVEHVGHEAGDEVCEVLHGQAKHHQKVGTLGFKIAHRGYLIYWLLLGIGAVFGILNVMQIEVWSEFVLYFGGVAVLISLILTIAAKKYISEDTHEEVEMKLSSLKETIIHSAQETAFIGVWVFLGLLGYEVFTLAIGGGESLFAVSGLVAVVVAALVGMIPGCGLQIVFITLYVQGLFPLAALFAHGISQDGDALFPLIVMDKKAAGIATLITTIVALVFGVGWWLLFPTL